MHWSLTGGSPTTIPGESTDKVHSGWIDATSFSFGVPNAPSLSGGVISGTKAVVTELTITGIDFCLGDGFSTVAGEQSATEEMHRWLAHYQATGVQRISGGFVVIEKCQPGSEWIREESRAIQNIDLTAGREVRRVPDNHTWLTTGPDLLESRFAVPDGIRAEANMALAATGWERQTTPPYTTGYTHPPQENACQIRDLQPNLRTSFLWISLPEILRIEQFAKN